MEGLTRNAKSTWDGESTQRLLLTDRYTPEPNSAGFLLDEHEHYSSSHSSNSTNEDYDMLDKSPQQTGDGSSQLTEGDLGSKISSATASFSASNISKPASQDTGPQMVEDEILKYQTIASKHPTEERVPIILVHGAFHTPQVRPHSPFINIRARA